MPKVILALLDRKMDILLALLAAVPVFIFIRTVGNPLYVGDWYYASPFIVAIVVGLILKRPTYFLTGANLVILITFYAYFFWQLNNSRPVGLLGLGHIFSLPGALIGLLLAAFIDKKTSTLPPYSAAYSKVKTGIISFIFVGLGFFINQLIICNSVMYCGSFLSFIIVFFQGT